MVIICAWCRRQVGLHGRDDGRVSHTVCDRCLRGLMRSASLARETTVLTPESGAPCVPTGHDDPCRHAVPPFATDHIHDQGRPASEGGDQVMRCA